MTQPSNIEEVSSWETQRPVELAALSKEYDNLDRKYKDLCFKVAGLLKAMYEHDTPTADTVYRILINENIPSRADIDMYLNLKLPPAGIKQLRNK